MKREEAIKRGYPMHEKQGSEQHRRAFFHNYSERGLYMITLVTRERLPLLGNVAGLPQPHVELSPLGIVVLNEEMPKINRHYPNVHVWRMCVMPDHLHFIVRVASDFQKGKCLGDVVRGFKIGCNRAYWGMMETRDGIAGHGDMMSGHDDGRTGNEPMGHGYGQAGHGDRQARHNDGQAIAVAVPSDFIAAPRPGLFADGYNDRLLFEGEQLERWKHYLDDNPRRLWMKRQRPDLFTTMHDMDVAGRKCQVFGNLFLLDIPDKVAIIVHRRYSEDEVQRLRREWLACGERGGVLIGTAVAPKEKEVMREAMNRGYKIIHLVKEGFPPLYKPYGEFFDACAKGQLLQISPWPYDNERKKITREQCLALNAIAEGLAMETRDEIAGHGDKQAGHGDQKAGHGMNGDTHNE